MVLKVKDIHWAAGFLEGEAYFGARKGRYPRPEISVDQKEKEPLLKLKKLFGGGVFHPGKSRYYRYGLYGKRAIALMMTVYSLMSRKRKRRIEKVLELWKKTGSTRS